jgi:hypothetical protein
MSYAKSNPLFELDIYRCQIDNSWNFFLSIFRWSFAIQLSKPESDSYDDYLGGNYSVTDEEEEEQWLKEFRDSVEGEEHLDDDHDYHELEGIYYIHAFNAFAEVKQFSEDLFQIEYENIPNSFLSIFHRERVKAIAIEKNLEGDLWEKVISP